jgi:CheY-like chemotaxis protein
MALRILVADDCRDTVDTTMMLLRLWGHEGTAAYDGPTALDQARRHRPDMALVDVAIPRVEDGLDLAGRLHSDVPLLVAVTGYADGEHRRRCEQAGFDLVFAKPLAHEQLQALLADAASVLAGARQPTGQERQGLTELRARWRRQQEPTAGSGDTGGGG